MLKSREARYLPGVEFDTCRFVGYLCMIETEVDFSSSVSAFKSLQSFFRQLSVYAAHISFFQKVGSFFFSLLVGRNLIG